MSTDQQIEKILDEQAGLLTYLRENYGTLEPGYRKCIVAAVDQLEEQWVQLMRSQYTERRKAWATEGDL